MRRNLTSFLLLLFVVACAASEAAPSGADADAVAADSAARDLAAHEAHANYVRVINSNKIDSLASMMADDIVFLSAGAKPIVGKAAVRAWANWYFKAFHTS